MSPEAPDGSERDAPLSDEEASQPSGSDRRARARLMGRVLGLFSLAIAFALFQFTQTATGRNAAISLIQTALAGSVNGELRLGPVMGGNLVTRVRLERLEIVDPDERLFVALDTVTIEYDPLALLRRQLRVRRLDARHADIRLVQGAEGSWNYDVIFGPSDAGDTAGDSLAVPDTLGLVDAVAIADSADLGAVSAGALRVIFGDATLADGSIEIRTPWTAALEGRDRERAIAEARGGMWYTEETDEGEYERVYRLENVSGRFPSIRLVDPPRPFRLQVADASATLYAVSQPLDVVNLTANVTFGDSIRVEIGRLETPTSTVTGSGWVVDETPLAYGFSLAADPLAFEDIQWLPVPVPATGGGPMGIDLSSRGPALIVDVTGGDIASLDTRIRGGFRLAVEPTPRFEDLDLDLTPLRLAWLDDLLGRPETMDGRVRGTLRGAGRIDDLAIEADVTFSDPDSEVPPSALRASGGVSLVEPYPIRELALELTTFEPRWMGVLGLAAPIDGRIEGDLTLDRPEGGTLAFGGDVSHFTPAGDLSRLVGSGSVDLEEGSVVDIAIDAQPLALAALRPWAREVELAGSVRGPIRARGNLDRLVASAELLTDRGRLAVDGTFGLGGEAPSYDAQVEARDLSLAQWVQGAPDSRLAVRGRVAGQGVERQTLDASFDLEILPSSFEKAQIYTSLVRFRVAEGIAEIDTLALDTDVGSFAGRGRFGLAEGRIGTLEFEADVPDLSDLNRWFAEEIPGGRAAEAGEALFESFEAALAAPEEEQTEGLSGRVHARGVVVGRWEDFDVEAFVEASRPRYETYRADTVSARVQLLDPPGTDRLVAQLTARNAILDGRSLDSLAVRLERSAPGAATLDLHARRDSTVELATRGEVEVGEGAWAVGLDWLRIRLGKLESSLVSPSRIAYSDSALVVDALVVNGFLGRITADGTIPARGDGALDLELFGVRVDQLGYLFSEEPEAGGTLHASARVGGTLDDPRLAGSLRIVSPSIRDQTYDSLVARLDYGDRRTEGRIDLGGRGIRLARLQGTVRADLALRPRERRLLDDPIDLTLRGDSLPLALLELQVRGLQDITGVAESALTLRGDPGDLRYGGSLWIHDGRAWVPDLGVWLERVGARASFVGSEARIDSGFVASDLGGAIRVDGEVDIASLTDPVFDLRFGANRFHAVSRTDMSLAIDGEGELGGRYTSPRLTGQFRLRDGDIRQDEFLRARQVIDLSDPAVWAVLDSASIGERRLLERFRNPFMDNLVIDAQVSLGPNLWLRSPTLDVEMVAQDLAVRQNRATNEVSVVGGVQLPRGTYRFDRLPPYVQSLRITGGTIQFVGDPQLNPNLDITAEYRNRTATGPVVVEARIGGTLARSTLDLSSNPPMSDSDQVCFLAVGTPCFQAADAQLGQRLLQETFLGTISSGLSTALVGSTGLSYFNIRSIRADPSTVAGSPSLFEQTLVEFGWYASDDLFFAVSQRLGGGTPRATLEWRFARNWALEARVANRFDERLFGLAQSTNLANEQTFGLFLFREWDFSPGR